jgi:hypothetical protein
MTDHVKSFKVIAELLMIAFVIIRLIRRNNEIRRRRLQMLVDSIHEHAGVGRLESVFQYSFEYGREWRSANPNGDGQKAWGVVKDGLTRLDNYKYYWVKNKMFEPFSGHANGKDVPHYLFQLWNLPHSEHANIRRVAQLAFNLGQFVGTVPENEWADWGFTPEMLKMSSHVDDGW